MEVLEDNFLSKWVICRWTMLIFQGVYVSTHQKVFHLQGFGFVQRIHSQKHDEATAVDGEGLLLDSRRWLPYGNGPCKLLVG